MSDDVHWATGVFDLTRARRIHYQMLCGVWTDWEFLAHDNPEYRKHAIPTCTACILLLFAEKAETGTITRTREWCDISDF